MAGNSHGHTTAAWTGVGICFVGFLIAGAAVVIAQPVVMWVGLAICLLGGVVGRVMSLAGLGQPDQARNKR